MLNHDPHFKDYLQFFEFFNGNDGRGLGASHQTGWTALVAHYICSDHAPALPGLLPGE